RRPRATGASARDVTHAPPHIPREGNRMTSTLSLSPVEDPAAWRGDALAQSTEWIYRLSDAERTELEEVGRTFVADDPDLRTVTAADYPLAAHGDHLREGAEHLHRGR